MADVLRLELSPFGVKVLSVVTGAISTNCLTYFQDWALPPDSRYRDIEEYFSKFVQNTNGMPRTPLETYATDVVDSILGGITGRIWVGERAEKMKNASFGGELAVLRVFTSFPLLCCAFTNFSIGSVPYEKIWFGSALEVDLLWWKGAMKPLDLSSERMVVLHFEPSREVLSILTNTSLSNSS